MEPGGLPPGSPCDVAEDLLAVPRTEETCDGGLCWPEASGDPSGTCRTFCDAQRLHDVAFQDADASDVVWPCPAGEGCVGFATVAEGSGLFEPRFGLCLPDPISDPVPGAHPCSVVTGTLVADPGTPCASAFADPEVGCGFVWDPLRETGGWGTVLGVCTPLPWGPLEDATVPVWGECDDATAGCPARSFCLPDDGTAGIPRCLPLCDTASELTGLGDCPELILAANPEVTLETTPVCRTVSPVPEDAFPARLGFCTRPVVTP
jgi:hypothetical protein